jgi:peptide/nickel transport system substrate-binding protein
MRWQIGMAVAVLAAMAAAPAQAQQRGGIATMLGTSDVDYLDPGHTYYTTGYMVALAQVRPLYGEFPGTEGVQPDLASGPPQISDHGKTVTVPLRAGVRFAPPVSREVEAKDVKYAMERAFSESVGGQYTFFFSDLVGAPKRLPRTPKPISGIEVVDSHTVRFQLSKRTGATFAAALQLPMTAPVPEEVAGPDDRKRVSTYEEHVVASGPYSVARRTKSIIKLRRNPNWDPATDPRPAYLDGVDFEFQQASATASAARVLKGSHLLFEANVAPATYRRYHGSHRAQFQTVASGGVRYMSLNTTVKAFRNINVRKAVIAGFDKSRLRNARGGALVGPVATHFLPPGVPGYAEAGGAKGPQPAIYAPKGNKKLMRKYFRKAGYRNGRYTGRETLLVVTAATDPGKAQAEEAVRQLKTMGFRVKLRRAPQDAVYTDFCQRPSKNVAMCGSAGWFKDFSDGASMLPPLFDSRMIFRAGNNNLAELRDGKVDRLIDAANVLPIGAARAKAWAAVDRQVTADAPAIPFVWDVVTLVRSADMVGALNPYSTDWDLSFSAFR